MKTSELTGAALDWAVAKAEGLKEEDFVAIDNLYGPKWVGPEYSSDWAQGGPIIQSERITLDAIDCGETWIAQDYWKEFPAVEASTPLVAAMRCYVASELGDEVEVPDELTTQGE